MDQVRIGIVGCGWAGQVHMGNLINIAGAKIVALASSNAERMAALAAKAGGEVRQYPTGREMIEAEKDLDAVILCVTPDRHEGLEQMCAERGIHMYIEKPIELDWDRAMAIQSAIEKAGVIASVGYQERYNPATDAVRAFLKDKQVYLVEARWIGGLVGAKWWRTKAESGGQIIEQSTHLFDMVRYLVGDGKVMGSVAMAAPAPGLDNDVEPCSVATVAMDCGAAAQVTTGCFLKDGVQGRITITIWCRDARVEYDWSGVVRLIDGEGTRGIEGAGFHKQAIEAFVDAVRAGDRRLVRSDFADAMKTFRMTLDAQCGIG